MKIVKENIEFKRGQDPKSSLNIGMDRKIYAPFEINDIPKGTYLAYNEFNMWFVLKWDNISDKWFRSRIWVSSEYAIESTERLIHVDSRDIESIRWIQRIH